MFRYLWIFVAVLAVSGPALATEQDGCSGPAALRPNACPTTDEMAMLPDNILQDHIFFVGGGAVLDPYAKHRLDLLAKALRTPMLANTCLRLIGHSDVEGDAEANLSLSLVRAEAVHTYLQAQLGPYMPDSWVEGHGETDPIPSLDDTDNMNRRVALWARTCPDEDTSTE